jgi:hypothetical protein
MSRNRRRVPLESGQKLDINQLMRDGVINLNGAPAGTLRASYPDGFTQEINFVSRKRHFGGRQYFFQFYTLEESARDGEPCFGCKRSSEKANQASKAKPHRERPASRCAEDMARLLSAP